MLDIKVSIENKEVVINGLNKLASEMPNAIKRGLKRVASDSDGNLRKQKSPPPGGLYLT